MEHTTADFPRASGLRLRGERRGECIVNLTAETEEKVLDGMKV